MRSRCLLPLAVACLLAGCGYYSTSSRTAKDIKSVAVPFIENRTPEPNLEIIVTEILVTTLIEDNTLSVRDEADADAVLEAKIVSFRNVPFSFNRDLNAEEYHVSMTMEATLFNRRLNQPIWENEMIKGDGSYFLDATQPEFTYEAALEETIREITDRVINLTVRDW